MPRELRSSAPTPIAPPPRYAMHAYVQPRDWAPPSTHTEPCAHHDGTFSFAVKDKHALQLLSYNHADAFRVHPSQPSMAPTLLRRFGCFVLPGQHDMCARVAADVGAAPDSAWKAIFGSQSKRHVADGPFAPVFGEAVCAKLNELGLLECDLNGPYKGQFKEAADVRAIRSLWGCKAQPTHTDYLKENAFYPSTAGKHEGLPLKQGDEPLIALLALNARRLRVLPRGCGSQPLEVDLKPGDLFVGVYNLAHAGGAHDQTTL